MASLSEAHQPDILFRTQAPNLYQRLTLRWWRLTCGRRTRRLLSLEPGWNALRMELLLDLRGWPPMPEAPSEAHARFNQLLHECSLRGPGREGALRGCDPAGAPSAPPPSSSYVVVSHGAAVAAAVLWAHPGLFVEAVHFAGCVVLRHHPPCGGAAATAAPLAPAGAADGQLVRAGARGSAAEGEWRIQPPLLGVEVVDRGQADASWGC